MSSSPAAVLDLGTNSTRFLALSSPEKGFAPDRIIDRDSVVTRLGEGLESSGRLAPEAIQRVVERVEAYDRRVQAHGGRWSDAIATHACRCATNGDQLLSALREILPISPRIISGEEEAELIHRGVCASLPVQSVGRVMDIGGGSTEWIMSSGDTVKLRSYPVGVVSLREECLTGEQWDEEAVQLARERVRSELPDDTGSGELVVVGGTGTTLSAVRQQLEQYDPTAVHGDQLPLAEIRRIEEAFCRMTPEQLADHPLIQPGREDIMVAGIIILEEFVRHVGLDRVIVSDFGPLAGALEEVAVHG